MCFQVEFTLVKFSNDSLLLCVWGGSLQGVQAHLHANLVLVRHALHGQSLIVHSFGLRLLSLFLIDSTQEHVRIGIGRILGNEATQYAYQSNLKALVGRSRRFSLPVQFHYSPHEIGQQQENHHDHYDNEPIFPQ